MPRNKDIDIGLAALCQHATYGQTLTQQEIADVCGCSKGGIHMLEKQAMDKLKKKVHLYAIAQYEENNETPQQQGHINHILKALDA